MTSSDRQRARAFDGVADSYRRGRPGFPAKAAAWLTGSDPTIVLEVGAGTGKLTRELVELGHDLYVTDPSEQMLGVLRSELPDVRTAATPAEQIPLPDASVEVVVAAQSFHWFDQPAALAEFARVLVPGGRLALVWNHRDETIPWVRRLGALIHDDAEQLDEVDPTDAVVTSGLFGYVETTTFRHSQQIDRESVQDLVLSRSNIALLDEPARERKLAEVLAFYDDYGRGMDGMLLPYKTYCYRSVVAPPPIKAEPEPPADAPADQPDQTAERPATPRSDAGAGSDRSGDRGTDRGDDDGLIFDLR